MNKRILSIILAAVMLLGILPAQCFAAGTESDALGEINIYSDGTRLRYLSVNGSVREQIYTYYNYVSSSGSVKQIPAYCVNPTQYGVPQKVEYGTPIKYLANEKSSDPKVIGIVANGYPNKSLSELGLQSKYEAYYATKMALWCHIISGWNIDTAKVNPSLTGDELAAAQRVLAAAKKIYSVGMTWTEVLEPQISCVPDKDTAYTVTIDGTKYKQQVFTFKSKTWVVNYDVKVAFADPDSVPAGTRIVDMDNNDITALKTSSSGGKFSAQFKVLYPESAIEGSEGSAQLTFSTSVYKYAIFYAVCQEKDKYGNLQNYIVDTDPVTTMRLSAVSKYSAESTTTEDEPDTGLIINKLETGSNTPLSGALFEVVDPDGATVGTFVTNDDGQIVLPVTLCGNYTVIEKQAPEFHLMPAATAQNVNVEYGKVAQVTFYNEPFGNLSVEKYSNTGEKLAGAAVRIKHIETGATYTAETNYNGRADFTKLKPGAYEIVEVTAPTGYKKDDVVHTATVVSGETTTFSLVNDELPGLRITKYNRKTAEIMPDVTFEIFRDTNSIGTFKTDQLGQIVLTDLEPGTYTVREIEAGSEYIVSTTPQEVELAAGDGIRDLTFFNDVKPGLRLVKIDSQDPSKTIAGAVFEIKSVDGKYGPKEFTTDGSGEIDLSALTAGAYVVTEKNCEGYVIDQSQRIIHLDPNEDAQFIFTNTVKPSLQILKVGADGEPLKGVTFRIARIEDGSHYLDRTTDAAGEILISGLGAGVYSVIETATVSDRILNAHEYHVQLFPGKTSTLVVENSKRPNLTVYKNDADTGEPVADTVFQVKAADGHRVDEIRTGTDGKAVLTNLLPGVYEVIERSVPSNYLMDAPSQLVTLYADRDSSVYFENHKKPGLTINKLDSVTGDPIKGARFEVVWASSNTSSGDLRNLGTFFTDENGQIVIDGLDDGWLKITELEPAKGYAIKEPAVQEVFIKGGENKSVTFENTPLSAIAVFKYDSKTGKGIEGAVFQLKLLAGTSGTGGTVIGTFKTSRNGSFTVTGLKAGTYIVEELASDEDHVIDTAPQTIYISGKDQDVVSVFFGNAPKGSLLVKKVDAVSGVPLSDVEFFVTRSDGSVIGDANGKFVTDSSGTFLVDGLEPGTSVVVRETRTKSGYILDDAAQTITIKAGATVTLEFRNQPKGNLIINKLSSSDNKPLAGVTFKITYSDGRYVDTNGGKISSNGLYYTDRNGQIILDDIDGTVIVTEVKTIKGYTISEQTRTQVVQVNPDDTQALTFYNDPVSRILIHKVDEVTGDGIYGVKFLLYDSARNPIGQYVSDQDGYVWIDDLPGGGRYYIKELEAEGYNVDPELKTVYVKDGATSEILWKNTPITGQIQVYKYAAEYNSITGTKAGTSLKGAVYEIRNARSGRVVERITTDSRGIAASKALPLGRYFVKEVSAPAYWKVDGKEFDVTLEYPNQIIKLEAFDLPAELGVTLTKTGLKQVLTGTRCTYSFTVSNDSNVPLDDFYLHDKLPYDASNLQSLTTGTYSHRLNYRILYRTNMCEYRVLANNLLTTENYSFVLTSLPLGVGEYVTDIFFDYGTVPEGFQSVVKPTLAVTVMPGVTNNYYLTNRADAGGCYQNTWEISNASWVSIVRNLDVRIPVVLPKTGY